MKVVYRSISILLILCLLFSVTGISAMASEAEEQSGAAEGTMVEAPVPEVRILTGEMSASAGEVNTPVGEISASTVEVNTPADSVSDEIPIPVSDKDAGSSDSLPEADSLPIGGMAQEEACGSGDSELLSDSLEPPVSDMIQTQNTEVLSVAVSLEDVEDDGDEAAESDVGRTLSSVGSEENLVMDAVSYLGESDQRGNRTPDETEEKDAESEQNAIVLDGEGKFDILVTDTVETEGTPILISESVTPENVSITVWKIDGSVEASDGEKHVVLEGTPGTESKEITPDSEAVEQAIHYIIRVESSQEDMIGLSGTEKVHDFDTAAEGKTVTMKISVPDGYTLKGAYNGEGEKVPLEKDDDGNYYVVVPRGGGVYLSAELEKKEDPSHDDDDDGWSYNWISCAGKKNGQEKRPCVIIFDFNGGTLNGSIGPVFVSAEIGETVTLLDAPTRPGYRFVRWASCPEVAVSMPGETFELDECVKFIAVWDGPAWTSGADHDDDDDDDDDGPDVTETVRFTEDSEDELDLRSVRVTGEEAIGVETSANCEVDVDRDVTVKGVERAAGVVIKAVGRTVDAEVETGDGVTVSASEGNAVGVQAAASGSGKVILEVEGDTKASSDSGFSTGIAASADSGSSVTIAVEGDLSTES